MKYSKQHIKESIKILELIDTDDIESMASMYRKLDMMALLLSIDSETLTGEIPDSNDYISSIVQEYPDVFIAFAAIDPWKGNNALEELERSVLELGLKGLKLHPVQQAVFPNDERIYINMGVILSNLGEFEEAIIVTKKAIKLKPSSYFAHANLGFIFKACNV